MQTILKAICNNNNPKTTTTIAITTNNKIKCNITRQLTTKKRYPNNNYPEDSNKFSSKTFPQ